mgnify:CR=1 FL=1
MSRLGDLLRTERLRRNLTPKQVGRMCGVSEGYIKEVEAGTRIIADDQARRILKKIGLTEQNESGFTLDDIAATVDLNTVPAKPVAPAPKKPETEAVYRDSEEKQVSGSVWLDALTSVLKRVPVYNAVMQEVDHRLLPVLDGRVEGASPEKVFFFVAPDDSMRGFRILKGDLALVLPAHSPIDGAVMLVEYNNHRCLRKLKQADAMRVLLQSYDREYAAETLVVSEVNFLGRVGRVEFEL